MCHAGPSDGNVPNRGRTRTAHCRLSTTTSQGQGLVLLREGDLGNGSRHGFIPIQEFQIGLMQDASLILVQGLKQVINFIDIRLIHELQGHEHVRQEFGLGHVAIAIGIHGDQIGLGQAAGKEFL